ncbi:MAG: hypothetical protein E6772_18075, partial [Dysgonomonas sp.]|nr:hypothetical protein [Dysgonomonas sp.]
DLTLALLTKLNKTRILQMLKQHLVFNVNISCQVTRLRNRCTSGLRMKLQHLALQVLANS